LQPRNSAGLHQFVTSTFYHFNILSFYRERSEQLSFYREHREHLSFYRE